MGVLSPNRNDAPTVLAVATALVLALAACGTVDGSLADEARDGLTIGIRFDQPGMGQRRADGKYVGFDVDVARYVAAGFGVAEEDITWREARPADRERLIEDGSVDFVVAAYSITDQRRERVAFAGPYFETGQGLLVRSTDTGITGPEALDGRELCSVTGSTSAQKVKDGFAAGVRLVEYGDYSDCVTALLAGKVDAVTTDEAILAGYVAANPELLTLVGEPFTTERYGVGLAKDDAAGLADVETSLEEMIRSGEWRAALERNLGASGMDLPEPPQVTGG
ncbi:glutamate ABC transporter substrate-binding protein [Saccharothrix longispora]|uniref:Glutamate transport system substrate-binding protein n=1 Tax=Saccharothrix longispora TaxID=33920 RepID=A0ABU1PTK1_9PSEU|nr:glutamate ABC transporter substrate-binding protein [Saccharothrix longispora]MDR6593439.1 glutamate transport system substrate-binding protein [Saccharothrix longispora]